MSNDEIPVTIEAGKYYKIRMLGMMRCKRPPADGEPTGTFLTVSGKPIEIRREDVLFEVTEKEYRRWFPVFLRLSGQGNSEDEEKWQALSLLSLFRALEHYKRRYPDDTIKLELYEDGSGEIVREEYCSGCGTDYYTLVEFDTLNEAAEALAKALSEENAYEHDRHDETAPVH